MLPLPTTDDLEEVYEEVKKLQERIEREGWDHVPLTMIAPLFEKVMQFA